MHWCTAVLDRANEFKDEALMSFLTTHMLVLEPRARSSAEACLNALEGFKYNAIFEGPPVSDNVSNKPNASLPDSRKRLAESCSSSDTIKPPKRRAQKTGHNNHRQNEQNDSEFTVFGSNWLMDSKCVGSSVADMGREDPSGWSSSSSNTSSAITNVSENRNPLSDVGEHAE
ncbi:hypothetical protein AJ78_00063 [Emergomyces pasteurianus Ep9510]|uniref:Uncharacterized protein n=1 Tax=Emergomyces pasteurianus Ep9510 TaxID=1447872 RepID=A0A1J9QV02_9EURO|nr:hypothetical protein AJ78_00063 [Emergomyces pasteurianus Ep9510]